MNYYQTYLWSGIIDPYRICQVYSITHPAQQHAIKTLLRAGNSDKSIDQDIQETIDTLQRWQQMRQEDLQNPSFTEFPE